MQIFAIFKLPIIHFVNLPLHNPLPPPENNFYMYCFQLLMGQYVGTPSRHWKQCLHIMDNLKIVNSVTQIVNKHDDSAAMCVEAIHSHTICFLLQLMLFEVHQIISNV